MPIAVNKFNGSHFTMLKMMEGFLRRESQMDSAGTHKNAWTPCAKAGQSTAGALDQRRRSPGLPCADREPFDAQRSRGRRA